MEVVNVMAAMLFNRGEIEYAIEAPTGETGETVPYGEVASLLYGSQLYIAYCDDSDTGDTQIYRLAGPTLVGGLEMVETEIQDTEFDDDDTGDVDGGDDGGDGGGDDDEDEEDDAEEIDDADEVEEIEGVGEIA